MQTDEKKQKVTVWKGRPTMEGAGVALNRVFGFHEVPRLDPFLLLDAFHSENPEDYKRGFPWHPHRGIETITYILDGDVEHGDSLGNGGIISTGDVQWMTAGSGIIHQEMPKGDGKGRMRGFQLWTNLPSNGKMMDPRYRDVKQNRIPEVKTANGATVKVISGEVEGVRGPVREIVTDPVYLDVSLPAGTAFAHKIKDGYTAFACVVEGDGTFDSVESEPEGGFDPEQLGGAAGVMDTLVLFRRSGIAVARAGKKPVRFLLVSGKPIGEPVAWYGPIVMNTQDELQKAFEEYRDGNFVKAGRG